HQQSRVENAFFRLKQAFGGRLRARRLEAQRVEATLACSVMNRFTSLGMPDSCSIGA
ncbi:MAG: IS5/IS1182 family transposase, partial [Planctomycetota bacterium]